MPYLCLAVLTIRGAPRLVRSAPAMQHVWATMAHPIYGYGLGGVPLTQRETCSSELPFVEWLETMDNLLGTQMVDQKFPFFRGCFEDNLRRSLELPGPRHPGWRPSPREKAHCQDLG